MQFSIILDFVEGLHAGSGSRKANLDYRPTGGLAPSSVHFDEPSQVANNVCMPATAESAVARSHFSPSR